MNSEIPAGTAQHVLASVGEFAISPIIGFIFQIGLISIIAVFLGFVIVIGTTLYIIKMFIQAAAKRSGILAAIEQNNKDYRILNAKSIDDLPLNFFDKKEYSRSRGDKASNYG